MPLLIISQGYLLDSWDIPFLTLHNKDIKEANASGGLQSKVDVLVFASEDPALIVNGAPDAGTPDARQFQPLPAEYAGEIGKEASRRASPRAPTRRRSCTPRCVSP